MKCADCQFNLSCHTGRLDARTSDRLHIVQLCPVCNRLSIGQDLMLYIFECEKRHFSEEQLDKFEDMRHSGIMTMASVAQMPDPGPGLLGKLSIGYCVVCMPGLPPALRDVTLKYLDEERSENIAEVQQRLKAQAISAEEDDEEPDE